MSIVNGLAAREELREAIAEADSLAALSKLNGQQKNRFDYLLSKISATKAVISAEEDRSASRGMEEEKTKKGDRESFISYYKTGEFRGLNTVTGSAGGFLIPADFQKELFKSIAQYSDLMNQENVHLLRTKTGSPITVPGFDLSTITSQIVGQGNTTVPSPGSMGTVTGNVLRGYTYKCSPIAATIEIEQDAFESVYTIFNQAFSLCLPPPIPAALLNANGSTAPLGLLTAAANSGLVTAASNTVTPDETNSPYLSLHPPHPTSPNPA